MIKLMPKTRLALSKLIVLHKEELEAFNNYQSYSNQFQHKLFDDESVNDTIKKLWDKVFSVRDDVDEQRNLTAQTFIEEYKLNDYKANLVDESADKSRVIYHSTGVAKRDIKEICKNLIMGNLHPGRFQMNQAGIAMYWGNDKFFERMNDVDEVIEAYISQNAKIHYVSVEDYKNFNMDEYKEYFDEEDYNMLKYIEENFIMHVRSIFDVAMGYDACVRTSSDGVSIWAIYNRSILDLERMPIKKVESVFHKKSYIKM